MSNPRGLKSTLLFNPFPTLVPTIRNRGFSHPPIQKNKLLPLYPHPSGQSCLPPPASSSTGPGSRRPGLSPRPSPGRPWAAPAHSRAWGCWTAATRRFGKVGGGAGAWSRAPGGPPAVRGRRPLAGQRHVATPAAILGHYLPPARWSWLGKGSSGREERWSGAARGGPGRPRTPAPACAVRREVRNHELLPGVRVVRQRRGRRRRAQLRAQVLSRRRPARGPAARLPLGQRRRRLRQLPAPGRSPTCASAPSRARAASRAARGRALLRAVHPGGRLRAGRRTCRGSGGRLRLPGAGVGLRLPLRARAAGRRRRGARPLRDLSGLLGRRLLSPQRPGGLHGLWRARPLAGVSERASRRPPWDLPDCVPGPRCLPQVGLASLRAPRRLQHLRVDESEEERP